MHSTQITFRDIPHSEAVYKQVHDYINKISHYCQEFTSCKVVLVAPPKHKYKGQLYSVRISLALPETQIIINHKHHPDLYVAIHDSFQALEKKTESYLQKRRENHRGLGLPTHGTIIKLFPDDNFGFIVDEQENEYYFNDKHLVTKHFQQLRIGDKVNFIGEEGREGLQASHITCRHHN